jgi:hypothetical protein
LLHLVSAAKPFVGPREGEQAGAAGLEGGANLPVEHRRLALLPVAQAVEPYLGHQERTFIGQVVESRQIRGELLP